MPARRTDEELLRGAKTRGQLYYAKNREEILRRCKERRQQHGAECRARERRYYAANREAECAKQKKWASEHKESVAARAKAYREANLEKRRAAVREWFAAHPNYKRDYYRTPSGWASITKQNAKRRAALQEIDCTLTADEWQAIKERNAFRCFYCKKKLPAGKLTQDHVTPLSKGGRHVKENIVPACQSCNSKKQDKVLFLL